MLKQGEIIAGRYTVRHQIGGGGMSKVYAVEHEEVGRRYAMKECKIDELSRESILRELEIMKNLPEHQYIVRIADIIRANESILLVMDYVEGIDLRRHLARQEGGKVSEEDVIKWAKQLCMVLSFLHNQSTPIIYRDMKPENIMLQPNGDIKLIDFGISREFDETQKKDSKALGTNGYAAAEQRYGAADARSDIYTLGVTLYQLLTGHDPTKKPIDPNKGIREYDSSLSYGLEKIIKKCLKDNPDERYQSCDEMLFDLNHFETLDSEYQKKLKQKFTIFMVPVVIFFVSLIVAFYARYKEVHLMSQTYDAFVNDAILASDLQSRLQSYEKAIMLEPTKIDGYKAILDVVMEDGYLDSTEDVYLRELFATVSEEGKTIEELFSANEQAYSDFAYNLAMDYWYYYGEIDEEGKIVPSKEYQIATRWLGKVTLYDSKNKECEKQFVNAGTYKKIGGYYANIGQMNLAGDNAVSYSTYFEDLAFIYKNGNANPITQLYLEKEIVIQVMEHATDYKAEKYDVAKVEEIIKSIKDGINMVPDDMKENKLYEEIRSSIEENIQQAELACKNAYEKEKGESEK